MPERPPDTGGLTPISVMDAVPGLRLATRDWRALAAMRSPVKVALWLALLKTSEELMSRESLVERLVSQDTTGTPDTGQDAAPETEEGYGPETSSIPAIVAWAESAVRRGIRGDMQAWSLVADRIEGKVQTRQGDVDPEDERRRGDIQSTIEAVIGAMTNARLSQSGDEPLDITPDDSTTMDSERQDSDAARRQELRETQQREQEDNQGRGETLAQTNEEPEERDLSDPLEGPRIVTRRTNGSGNGHA